MKHYFYVEVARLYGLHEAVIFSHVLFWIKHNRAKGREPRNGRFWMYQSVAKMAEELGYLSPKQIRTALNNLVNAGVLVVGEFNKDRRDRTAWYSFSDRWFDILREAGEYE